MLCVHSLLLLLTCGAERSLAACAGINLNLPVIGRVLRGLGAFFIRRKFTGLPDSSLYREVLAGAVLGGPGKFSWLGRARSV